MPYGGGPKSGCRRLTALGFVARPLIQSMYCCELPSIGAERTSRFHQLFAGNTCREASDSLIAGAVCADTTAVAAAIASAIQTHFFVEPVIAVCVDVGCMVMRVRIRCGVEPDDDLVRSGKSGATRRRC